MTERAAGSKFGARTMGKGEPVDDDLSIQDYLEQILKELNAARTIPSTSLALRQRAGDDAVDTSEWQMPSPAVIRFSSPGRTIACTPALSRCSTSPLNSQLTV